MVRIIATVLMLFLCASCSTTVNLVTRNGENFAQDTQIDIKDDKGSLSERIHAGIIQSDNEIHKTFKVDHGGQFSVTSSIPGSATVFEETRSVTAKDPDPLNVSITLKATGDHLDDNRAMTIIQDAFSKLGPKNTTTPIPLRNALDTIFGALIVFTPPDESQDGQIYHKIQPGLFSKRLTLGDFHYPETNNSRSIQISQSAAVQIASSVPLFAQFSFTTGASDLYEFQWTITGFGMIDKPEDPSWSYIAAINNLDNATKSALFTSLKNDPKAKLMYVNRIYVLKRAKLTVTEAKKLSVGNKIGAGDILTASGAYSFDKSTSQTQEYENAVLNFGGLELNLQIMEANFNLMAASAKAGKQNEFKFDEAFYAVESEKEIESFERKNSSKVPVIFLEPNSRSIILSLSPTMVKTLTKGSVELKLD